MIMMLGHDGQERREVGREWKNVLFFKIKFCTAKTMGMFRWSGSVFDRLIPERMISNFLLLENV